MIITCPIRYVVSFRSTPIMNERQSTRIGIFSVDPPTDYLEHSFIQPYLDFWFGAIAFLTGHGKKLT